MYCMYCGRKAEEERNCAGCGYPIGISEDNLPYELQPMGAWSYFGHSILFSIPVAGFIILICFACGCTSNINKRNYARSFFCGFVISAIIIALVIIILLAMGYNLNRF